MKKLLFIVLVSLFSPFVHASYLCSSQDVTEAANILLASKKAMEAGQLHRALFLEQERLYFKAQHCAKQVSDEQFCLSISNNLKAQLKMARDSKDRAYFNSIFKIYIDGMSALPNSCR